jgi:hypothetical protein
MTKQKSKGKWESKVTDGIPTQSAFAPSCSPIQANFNFDS